MKSVLALSALLFARAVFAQDSLAASTTSATPTDSVVSTTATDSSTFASSSSTSVSASLTDSSSSASRTNSAKVKGTSSSAAAAAAAATGASYTIPSGISSGCSKFLDALNSDTTLGSCTAPLLTATSSFGPGSNATQNQNSLTTALNKLCSSPGCSDKYIRTQLTNFASAYKAELDPSSGNKSVRDTYDILYIMQPLQETICSKDNDGTYCVLKAPSNASNSTSSSDDNTGAVVNAVISEGTDSDAVNSAIGDFLAHGVSSPGTLKKRAQQTFYAPDTATYRETGVMYLFILPNLSAASLCTPCTQKILSAYAAWESTVPYATGLSNSPMLGGQSDLWNQVQKTCGSTFMNVVKASVGTANAETNAGVSSTQVGVSSAVAGVFALAMGFWVAL